MDPALAVELAALSRQKAMNEALSKGDSPVQQFYNSTTVFMTGGSGFLGKQLIEKLFRACCVDKVYLLLRPKKGKTAQERVEEMLKDPVYDMVKRKKPNFAEKIVALEGDVGDTKLGLSDKDWTTLTEDVDVIFHVAATTRFNECLRVATMINVRGTREALLLGKDCKKLKSFVYVSTTYANATDSNLDKVVLEKFYESPMAPELLIHMVEKLHEDRLAAMEDNLIKGYENTYTFTKAIAEEVVRTTAGCIPISIVRPAVVISSYREPTPGWADMSCAYGAAGLILGPATGLIHVNFCSGDTKHSLVPVDYVNNAILAAGWRTATNSDNDIKIYSVSTAKNLFHWREVSSTVTEIGRVLPTPFAMWYVYVINTSNRRLFLILTWLLHYIPGLVLDAGCILLGKPPMFLKLYRKCYNLSLTLSYFTTHSWTFDDHNTDKLFQTLSPNDKLIFDFDTTDINIKEYLTLWCVGIRKYLIKDGIKNTEYAVRKQYWLQKLNYLVTGLYIFSLYKLLSIVIYFIVSVFMVFK